MLKLVSCLVDTTKSLYFIGVQNQHNQNVHIPGYNNYYIAAPTTWQPTHIT